MLLSWIFIPSCTTFFFIKKFIFSNVYISVNTIFECLYMFFGWKRSHQLSTYATGGAWGLINAALLNIYSILHYLFFHKEIYFFECIDFSEYNIRMSLYVFWLKKESSIKYVRNWWGLRIGKCKGFSKIVRGRVTFLFRS